VALEELDKNIEHAPQVVGAAQLQARVALHRRVPAKQNKNKIKIKVKVKVNKSK
jgi:hypothetical protein